MAGTGSHARKRESPGGFPEDIVDLPFVVFQFLIIFFTQLPVGAFMAEEALKI
jgi:hypothetical protein